MQITRPFGYPRRKSQWFMLYIDVSGFQGEEGMLCEMYFVYWDVDMPNKYDVSIQEFTHIQCDMTI